MYSPNQRLQIQLRFDSTKHSELQQTLISIINKKLWGTAMDIVICRGTWSWVDWVWPHYFPPFCLIFLSSEQGLHHPAVLRVGMGCCEKYGTAMHKLLTFWFPNVWCGFEDLDDQCMICVGAIQGSPLLQLFWHYFEMWNQHFTSTHMCSTTTVSY